MASERRSPPCGPQSSGRTQESRGRSTSGATCSLSSGLTGVPRPACGSPLRSPSLPAKQARSASPQATTESLRSRGSVTRLLGQPLRMRTQAQHGRHSLGWWRMATAPSSTTMQVATSRQGSESRLRFRRQQNRMTSKSRAPQCVRNLGGQVFPLDLAAPSLRGTKWSWHALVPCLVHVGPRSSDAGRARGARARHTARAAESACQAQDGGPGRAAGRPMGSG